MTASTRRRRLMLTVFAALCVVGATTATAAGAQNYIGAPSGVEPLHGTAQPGAAAPKPGLSPMITPFIVCPALDGMGNPTPSPLCPMTYHGGPLMLTNNTHIIYWQPAGFTTSANYHSLVERYLTDVAADSGRVANPYAVDTQYTDSTMTHIAYNSTYAGALTDTTAYPAAVSGCNNQGTSTVCLTETQQINELDSFIQSNSLPRGINDEYFMVLPRNVQTCFDDFSDCGPYGGVTDPVTMNFSEYCAYHTSFNVAGHGLTLFANMPDGADGGCNVISSPPNGDGADTLIDSLSHEHNETITDPASPGGWFDANGGGENGDKCNFTFGPNLGTSLNGPNDVIINHNPYQIQPEWDNSITGCSMTFGAVTPTAAFTFSPPSPLALQTVNFDGSTSASNDAGGYIIKYAWDFGDSGTASGATPSHIYSVSGSYTVTLTVTDDAGKTATTSHTVTVTKNPTTTVVTADHNPSVFGQPVTFTATVAPNDGGGTVAFTADGNPITGCGAKTLTASSPYKATCTTASLSVAGSPHAIVATYTGDGAYAGSTSATFNQTVNKDATTTTVTASPASPSNFGASVTFTATVTANPPGAGTPTGSVAFTVDGTPVGTVALSGTATASITTASLSAGPHTIGATYSGDGSFLGSSGSLPYTVTCTTTLTGVHSGSLEVTASTCVKSGGQVYGSITVHGGASLDIEGATINGAINANGTSGVIRICGSHITSSLDIKNATGLVIVGDPGDAACAPNTFSGSFTLQNNSGGVEAINNTVAGAITTTGNSGPGPFPGDVTTISGNHH